MSNTSVRIECINLPANKSSSNERLGYLLFKVKEAQTVNPASNDRVSNVYLKLMHTIIYYLLVNILSIVLFYK